MPKTGFPEGVPVSLEVPWSVRISGLTPRDLSHAMSMTGNMHTNCLIDMATNRLAPCAALGCSPGEFASSVPGILMSSNTRIS